MAATYAFVIVSYTLFNSCIILVFVIAHHVIDIIVFPNQTSVNVVNIMGNRYMNIKGTKTIDIVPRKI